MEEVAVPPKSVMYGRSELLMEFQSALILILFENMIDYQRSIIEHGNWQVVIKIMNSLESHLFMIFRKQLVLETSQSTIPKLHAWHYF